MKRRVITLKYIHALVTHFLIKINHTQLTKRKGRPKKYKYHLIITLWLYQILNRLSYIETLEKAKQEGFTTPSLNYYHYGAKSLDEELLRLELA